MPVKYSWNLITGIPEYSKLENDKRNGIKILVSRNKYGIIGRLHTKRRQVIKSVWFAY